MGADFGFAYIGCRTSQERGGRGEGLRVMGVGKDQWTEIEVIQGLTNPTYLAIHPDGHVLYAVHGDGTEISAFARDRGTGRLEELNRKNCGGRNPVHVSVEANGKRILIANYASGTIASLSLDRDGAIGELESLVQLHGIRGPHSEQQTGSHPHQVAIEQTGKYLFVPDKGLDKISIFELRNVENGPCREVPCDLGAGPRHIAFHPNQDHAYVVNELNSSITTYRWDWKTLELRPLETQSSLPADISILNTASGVCVDSTGQYLYVSNRGHDSVVQYRISDSRGVLKAPIWMPAGGKIPRYIGLWFDKKSLVVANEGSHSVKVFRPSNDGIEEIVSIDTGSPTCVLLIGSL